MSERRPWLTRNLKIVSAVSLLQDAASELLYPLLPILLTTVLGAPAVVVGAVEGIEFATQSQALEWLASHGFPVSPDVSVVATTLTRCV